jgi:hypothetical protein
MSQIMPSNTPPSSPGHLRALVINHLPLPCGKYLPPSKFGTCETRLARGVFGMHINISFRDTEGSNARAMREFG